jgi:ABC-type transporter MlaC component
MRKLHEYATEILHLHPEQVQVFTPTPSTYASLMYYTEKDPFSGQKLFVEKNPNRKSRQKDIVTREAGSRPSSSSWKSKKVNPNQKPLRTSHGK